jgi:hypothetical protein
MEMQRLNVDYVLLAGFLKVRVALQGCKSRESERYGFRVGDRSRGRFAMPADFTLHDGSPYSHVHVRRERLGVVARSSTIFCRAVPNLGVTIRNFCIAERLSQHSLSRSPALFLPRPVASPPLTPPRLRVAAHPGGGGEGVPASRAQHPPSAAAGVRRQGLLRHERAPRRGGVGCQVGSRARERDRERERGTGRERETERERDRETERERERERERVRERDRQRDRERERERQREREGQGERETERERDRETERERERESERERPRKRDRERDRE